MPKTPRECYILSYLIWFLTGKGFRAPNGTPTAQNSVLFTEIQCDGRQKQTRLLQS